MRKPLGVAPILLLLAGTVWLAAGTATRSGVAQRARTATGFRLPSQDELCDSADSPLSTAAMRERAIVRLASTLRDTADSGERVRLINAVTEATYGHDSAYIDARRSREEILLSQTGARSRRGDLTRVDSLDSIIRRRESDATNLVSNWYDESLRAARNHLANAEPRSALKQARTAYCLRPDAQALVVLLQAMEAAHLYSDLLSALNEAEPPVGELRGPDPLERAVRRRRIGSVSERCGSPPVNVYDFVRELIPSRDSLTRERSALQYCWTGDVAFQRVATGDSSEQDLQGIQQRLAIYLQRAREIDALVAQDDHAGYSESILQLSSELSDVRITKALISLANVSRNDDAVRRLSETFRYQVSRLQNRLSAECASSGPFPVSIQPPTEPATCAPSSLPPLPAEGSCPARMRRDHPTAPCCPETMGWNGASCVALDRGQPCAQDMYESSPGNCSCIPGREPGPGTNGTCCWPGQVATSDRVCRNRATSCLSDFVLVAGQCVYRPSELNELTRICNQPTEVADSSISRYEACEIVSGWHRSQRHDQETTLWREIRALEARACDFFDVAEASSSVGRLAALIRLQSLCLAAANSYAVDDVRRARNLLFSGQQRGANALIFRMFDLADRQATTEAGLRDACLAGDLAAPWAARVCLRRAQALPVAERESSMQAICVSRPGLPEDLAARREACISAAALISRRGDQPGARVRYFDALRSAPASESGSKSDDELRDLIAVPSSERSVCGRTQARGDAVPVWSDWSQYRCVELELIGSARDMCLRREQYSSEQRTGCPTQPASLCCPLRSLTR